VNVVRLCDSRLQRYRALNCVRFFLKWPLILMLIITGRSERPVIINIKINGHFLWTTVCNVRNQRHTTFAGIRYRFIITSWVKTASNCENFLSPSQRARWDRMSASVLIRPSHTGTRTSRLARSLYDVQPTTTSYSGTAHLKICSPFRTTRRSETNAQVWCTRSDSPASRRHVDKQRQGGYIHNKHPFVNCVKPYHTV